MSDGFFQRFLFEELDIRGVVVRLEGCWRAMLQGRMYAPPVARVLGEMAAVTALMGGQMKQSGRLTFQLRGQGPIQRLVVDCNDQLQMRGMAMADLRVEEASVPVLLGAEKGGQLLISLDLPLADLPYQSVVPMAGDSVAAIFEHYFIQSEQQPSRLFLFADDQAAAGLFLQQLPTSFRHDEDAWDRVTQLASTVKAEEILTLTPEVLLTRLFHEEVEAAGVRVYAPRTVTYHCPEDWEKVERLIRALGRDEAEAVLSEHGEIVIQDDICAREYRFSWADLERIFGADGKEALPTLH